MLAGLKAKANAISADIVKMAAARGRDISHLAAELADDAAGGMGLKIAELDISERVLLAMLARQRIPAAVNAAGYRTAQNLLRRMAHVSVEQLAGWHETMAYEDTPDKDELAAAFDHAAAVLERRRVLARSRALIAAAKQFAANNHSQRRQQKLAADIRLIVRATKYMLALIGNTSATFELRGKNYLYQQVSEMLGRLEPLAVTA